MKPFRIRREDGTELEGRLEFSSWGAVLSKRDGPMT
jgi:hypothetical protein